MGQAFLRGQSGGGKIDFSKLKRQLVYSDWARKDRNSEIPFSTTGIGIYEISYRSSFWTTSSSNSVVIMKSDGTNLYLSNYLGLVRAGSAGSDVFHVTIVVEDNGNGTYSVYGWHTSTGAYTLITDTAAAIKVVDSSAIVLLVTRLYE